MLSTITRVQVVGRFVYKPLDLHQASFDIDLFTDFINVKYQTKNVSYHKNANEGVTIDCILGVKHGVDKYLWSTRGPSQ